MNREYDFSKAKRAKTVPHLKRLRERETAPALPTEAPTRRYIPAVEVLESLRKRLERARRR